MAGGLRLPRHAHGSGQLVFVLGGSYFKSWEYHHVRLGAGIRPLPATAGAPRQPFRRCRSAGPGRGLSARAAGGARRLPTAARAAGHGGRPAPGARARARAWRPRRERGARGAGAPPPGARGARHGAGRLAALAGRGAAAHRAPPRRADLARDRRRGGRRPPRHAGRRFPSPPRSLGGRGRSARRGCGGRSTRSARSSRPLAEIAGGVRLLRSSPHGAAGQARHRRDAGGDPPPRRRSFVTPRRWTRHSIAAVKFARGPGRPYPTIASLALFFPR